MKLEDRILLDNTKAPTIKGRAKNMTNTLTMDTLYDKLTKFGITKRYVNKNGLPSWWDKELNDKPFAVLECSGYIANRFGLDLKSLLSKDDTLRFSGLTQTKFKERTHNKKSEIAHGLAHRFAQIIAEGCDNTDYTHLKILNTFKYVTKKRIKKKQTNQKKQNRRRLSRQPDNYDLKKCLKIGKKLPELSETHIDIDIFSDLINISKSLNDNNKNIDEGEATLISYLLTEENNQNSSNYLLTGDKRCLRALATPEIKRIVQPLEGKIWCFEQLVLRNIEQYGFDVVKKKVLPVKSCDGALNSVFGSGESTTKENAENTLKHYINELRNNTGNLLYPYPD